MGVGTIIYPHVTSEMDEDSGAWWLSQGHAASDWWKSIQTQLHLLPESAF